MKGHNPPDEEGIISVIKHESVLADREYLKQYPSVMDKLVLLNGCPVNLYFFLCEESSDTNQVNSDEYTIKRFLNWMYDKSKGAVSYSVPMVRKSFKALRDQDILLTVQKGRYLINPFYFWKSHKEGERIDCIRFIMEKMSYKPHL
jgi:hypothetical protein